MGPSLIFLARKGCPEHPCSLHCPVCAGPCPSSLLSFHGNSRGEKTQTFHFIYMSLICYSLCCLVASRVQLFVTSQTAAGQASLSFTIFWSLLKLMSIELVMPSSCPLWASCFHSSPVSGSFPVSRLFASGGQRIGASASASVLPMNIQG